MNTNEIFLKKIDEYNASGAFYRHMVWISEHQVMEIYWSGARWEYKVHRLEVDG